MAEQAERTEPATPRRREAARRQGHVVLSPEVGPAAVLLVALAAGAWGGPQALARTRALVADWLAGLGPLAAHDGAVWPVATRMLLGTAALVAPFLLAAALVAAGAVVGQVGWSFDPGLLRPAPARLSPGAGLRRVCSLAGAVDLVKAVVKIVLVLWVACHVLRTAGMEALAAPSMTPPAILALTGDAVRRLLVALVLVLAAIGVADWLWQRWRHETRLRMTRREVREEQKETEGDPFVRARFRQAHRELARRRMLAPVAQADVVLTEGAGEVAERILATVHSLREVG